MSEHLVERLRATDWTDPQRLMWDAADEIERLEQALRNVAAACNQLEGYPNLARDRQVELVQAIRRFTGIKHPQILRAREETDREPDSR